MAFDFDADGQPVVSKDSGFHFDSDGQPVSAPSKPELGIIDRAIAAARDIYAGATQPDANSSGRSVMDDAPIVDQNTVTSPDAGGMPYSSAYVEKQKAAIAEMPFKDQAVLAKQPGITGIIASKVRDQTVQRLTEDTLPSTLDDVRRDVAEGAFRKDSSATDGDSMSGSYIPEYGSYDSKPAGGPSVSDIAKEEWKGVLEAGNQVGALAGLATSEAGHLIFDKVYQVATQSPDSPVQDYVFEHAVKPFIDGAKDNALPADASFSQKAAHTIGGLGVMMLESYITAPAAFEQLAANSITNILANSGRSAFASMAVPASVSMASIGQKVLESGGDQDQAGKAMAATFLSTIAMGMGQANGRLANAVMFPAISSGTHPLTQAALPENMRSDRTYEDVALDAILGFGMGHSAEKPIDNSQAVRDTYNAGPEIPDLSPADIAHYGQKIRDYHQSLKDQAAEPVALMPDGKEVSNLSPEDQGRLDTLNHIEATRVNGLDTLIPSMFPDARAGDAERSIADAKSFEESLANFKALDEATSNLSAANTDFNQFRLGPDQADDAAAEVKLNRGFDADSHEAYAELEARKQAETDSIAEDARKQDLQPIVDQTDKSVPPTEIEQAMRRAVGLPERSSGRTAAEELLSTRPLRTVDNVAGVPVDDVPTATLEALKADEAQPAEVRQDATKAIEERATEVPEDPANEPAKPAIRAATDAEMTDMPSYGTGEVGDPIEQLRHRAIAARMNLVGRELRIVDPSDLSPGVVLGADGYAFHDDGRVFLSRDSSVSPDQVANHEFGHTIEKQLDSMTGGAEFKAALDRSLADNGGEMKGRFVFDRREVTDQDGKVLFARMPGETWDSASGERQAAAVEAYDANKAFNDSEYQQDHWGVGLTKASVWERAFYNIQQKYGTTESVPIIARLVEAVKLHIEAYKQAFGITNSSGNDSSFSYTQKAAKNRLYAIEATMAKVLAEHIKAQRIDPETMAVQRIEAQGELRRAELSKKRENVFPDIEEGKTAEQSAPLSEAQWQATQKIGHSRLSDVARISAVEAEDKYLAANERANRASDAYKEIATKKLADMPTPQLSTVPIMKGDSNPTIKGTGSNGQTRVFDVARVLRNRVLSRKATIETPEGREKLARALVHEAMYSLSLDGHAVGWYDRKIHEALAVSAIAHPEILTNPDANLAFRLIAAVTSNGHAVRDNFLLTHQVYADWKKNGEFPTEFEGGGTRAPAMKIAFDKLNTIVGERGSAEAERQLMTLRPVRAIEKEFGVKISGELKDALVPTAVGIGGPKIGNFFANLSGYFDSPTMDLWFMRTIGRMTGGIIATKPGLVGHLDKMLGILPESGLVHGVDVAKIRKEVAAYKALSPEQQLDPEQTIKTLKNTEQYGRSQYARFAAMDANGKTFTDKSPANENARSLKSNLSALVEAPSNGTQREQLRQVVGRSLELLESHGVKLNAADLQAVLWYYEKNLYGKLGDISESAKPWDYASAARFGVGRHLGLVDVGSSDRAGSLRGGESEPGEDGSEGVAPPSGQSEQGIPSEVGRSDSRAFFEVAPDPRDPALKAAWDRVSDKDKQDISDTVKSRIIPRLLASIGVEGRIVDQLGGWMDDTNPSFALLITGGDPAKALRAVGYVLTQEATYGLSMQKFDGAAKSGIIEIDVSGLNKDQVHEIYMKVRGMDPENVSGHSTIDGVMQIGVPIEGLGDRGMKITQILGKRSVYYAEGYSAEVKEYGYAADQRPTSQESVTEWADVNHWKGEASNLFRDELAARGAEVPSQSARREEAPDADRFGGLREPGERTRYGQAQDGSSRVEGLHYSESKRSELDSSRYGQGMPGAERTRLNRNSATPEQEGRIHFYVNEGKGTQAEPGVGYHAHAVDLQNLYDWRADSLGLWKLAREKYSDPDDQTNYVEQAVIAHGFDGVYARGAQNTQGVAVLLGKHNVPVDYLGMGKKDTAPSMSARREQTESPEFKKWFGDSKVVDENGDPRVVYHGTDKTFNKVNMKKGAQGVFWVTSNKASIDNGEVGAAGAGKVMPLYAKLENPAGWKEYDQLSLDEIEHRGFDGVMLTSKGDQFDAIIFNPTQVKSATGNRGTFDPADADIRRSSVRDNPIASDDDAIYSAASVKSSMARFLKVPGEMLKTPMHALGTSTMPMSMGSDQAKVVATRFADQQRGARWQWGRFDDILQKRFTKDQQVRMWNAADEENDLLREGRVDPTKGLASLTLEERRTVELLHNYGNELLTRAKLAGMYTGEGVDYWAPRMVALIGEDGSISKIEAGGPKDFSKEATNLRVKSSSLNYRKHDTTAETEAAAQAYAEDGQRAEVVRNIRTMPMAMARLEQAIAGRELINQIKAIGQSTGEPIVAEGKMNDPDYFTIKHPAMTNTQYTENWVKVSERELLDKNYIVRNGEVLRPDPKSVNGYIPVKGYRVADASLLGAPMNSIGQYPIGAIERKDMVANQTPIYIRKDFEGPLKAVLNVKHDLTPVYNGLMELKSKSMGLIMMSPMIHNAVEYGRSVPMMLTGGGAVNAAKNVLTLGAYTYFVGNRAKQDASIMQEAIAHGLVPIGHRGIGVDLNGIADPASMEVGRSWTAKALGYGVDAILGKSAGDKTRAGVDAAGKFWHETLLWNRIGDLQMGLYQTMKTSLINKGVDQYTANTLAAHFANRYAGALPQEAMSQGAREVLNLALFSRTFTTGNLGAMKDMLTGIPANRKAMIEMNAREVAASLGKDGDKAGSDARSLAASLGRKKAIATFILDIGLMYVANSLVQNWFKRHNGDETWKDQVAGYANRLGALKTKFLNDPLSVVTHPFNSISSISSTADNAAGREERIRVGNDSAGNTIYMRLPFGKIGEEFVNYTTPEGQMRMLQNKLSQFAKPTLQWVTNDMGVGQKLYDKNDPAYKQVGAIALNYVKAMFPGDMIGSAWDLATSNHPQWQRDQDKRKLIGPLVGVTYGMAKGGDAVQQEYQMERDFQDRRMRAMPKAMDALMDGKEDKAAEILASTGMTNREVNKALARMADPGLRDTAALRRIAERHATEEERARLDRTLH